MRHYFRLQSSHVTVILQLVGSVIENVVGRGYNYYAKNYYCRVSRGDTELTTFS